MIAETLLFRLAIYPGIIGHEKGGSGCLSGHIDP